MKGELYQAFVILLNLIKKQEVLINDDGEKIEGSGLLGVGLF